MMMTTTRPPFSYRLISLGLVCECEEELESTRSRISLPLLTILAKKWKIAEDGEASSFPKPFLTFQNNSDVGKIFKLA